MRLIVHLIRLCGSRALTVILMAVLALAMAAITVAEAVENTKKVPYWLYLHWSFTTLMILAGINLLCNALHRSWWHWRKLPGIATHLGMLLILGGGLLTWRLALRGDVPISEGSRRDSFNVREPVLRASWKDPGGGDDAHEDLFPLTDHGRFQCRTVVDALTPFAPGRTVTLPNGTTVTLLERAPSSRLKRRLEELPPGEGLPGVVFSIGAPEPTRVALVAGERTVLNRHGISIMAYGHRAEGEDLAPLLRLARPEWIELSPIAGRPITIPIVMPEDVGKEFSKGDYTVQVLEFHRDFKVGRTPSPDDPLRNPAVKLLVRGPSASASGTIYAFSRMEFHGSRLNDGTQVRYHRLGGEKAVLVLSRANGGFEAYRGTGDGPFEFSPGGQVTLGEGTAITVEFSCRSARGVEVVEPDGEGRGRPAVRVRVGPQGAPVWLSAEGGEARSRDGLTTAVLIDTYPLGFELTLDKAVAKYWPGSIIPRAYYSFVTVDGPDTPEPIAARIETNDPLLRNGFRLYQSMMSQRRSTFAVARDPGLPLVTLGFLVLSAGLLWLFISRFVVKPLRARRAAGTGAP